MTPDERWLTAIWPIVREQLPAAPSRVLEIGCGSSGGFVPMMRSIGHEATGVDPLAPGGSDYEQVEFERYEPRGAVDAVVVCNSLHHVKRPGQVVELIAAALGRDGVCIVIEWARELFDEATANWCFERLDSSGPPGWLHRRRDDWRASGQSWDTYLHGWGEEEGVHSVNELIAVINGRFACGTPRSGPRFFAELAGVSEADEQAAIDAGLIRATRIDFIARLR